MAIGWPTEWCWWRGAFEQWASTLKSGDTGLTLNFGNAWFKEGKKTLSTRIFRECQGSGMCVRACVRACVLWWDLK